MSVRKISFFITSNYSPDVYKRTVSLTVFRAIVVLLLVLLVGAIVAFVLAGSSAYRVTRIAYLERRNQDLEGEFRKVSELRDRLESLEGERARFAEMLGVDLTPPPVDWAAGPVDSTGLPEWIGAGDWGGRPVPALPPVTDYVVSHVYDSAHSGIDLAARAGARVRATADGVVVRAGTDSVYGNYVLLQHPNEYASYYGHLEAATVEDADTVRVGQSIGTVGSSGRSSAPHLHFEIRRHGEPVDPGSIIRF